MIFLTVQIYVDEIIFSSTDILMCNEFSDSMSEEFKMSMMGIKFLLRIAD